MFIASFRIKTFVQKLLYNVQELLDYPTFHPGRAMLQAALGETVDYVRAHMAGAVAVETARQALDLALRHLPADGHVLECGVYKGGTIRYIAARVSRREVHGFDSFAGLPESWAGNTSGFDAKGRLPKVPANVRLHRGFFSESLPPWLASHDGPVAFLHIDCDLYASTRDIFQALGPRLTAGTIVVFDEYFNYPHWQQHEFKAFQEFVAAHGVTYEYLAYARLQVVVRILGIAH
jgi:hypothetical protein